MCARLWCLCSPSICTTGGALRSQLQPEAPHPNADQLGASPPLSPSGLALLRWPKLARIDPQIRANVRKILAPTHKIGAAISGPRIADKTFFGHEDFSENGLISRESFQGSRSSTEPLFCEWRFGLECRKWGFKRWGFKQIRGYLRKKAFFLRFLDFSGAVRALRKKAEKGRKRAKKADFGRFPGQEARHPLNPHLLHPHLRHSNRGAKKCESQVWGDSRESLARYENISQPQGTTQKGVHAHPLTAREREHQFPRGPCDRKKSIPIENFNPGSKISIPIEMFNLDRKIQSPSFHLRGPSSVQRKARSKISIQDRSLEIFNPEGRDRIFSIPGPSGFCSIWAMNFGRQ